MFDLKALKTSAAKPVPMVVEDPATGEPLPGVTISLLSIDSDEYQKASRTAQNRHIRAAKKNGNRAMQGVTAATLQADQNAQYAAATVGWEGLTDGKDEFPFSPENALALYTNYPALRDQVAEFINDRSNFLGNS